MVDYGVRSGCNSGVNASVMSHQGGNHRGRAMACGLSQCLLMAGLGLEVVGSIERDPNLGVVMVPVCVVGLPVKGFDVDGAVILNQLLFHKVASI